MLEFRLTISQGVPGLEPLVHGVRKPRTNCHDQNTGSAVDALGWQRFAHDIPPPHVAI